MKKYYFTLFIVLFMGIIFGLFGYFNHGFQPVVGDTILGSVHVLRHEDSKQMHTYQTKQPFKALTIFVDQTDILIKQGSQYSVNFETNQKATVKVSDQQLEIKQKARYNFQMFYFPVIKKSTLTITIPNLTTIDKLNLSIENCRVRFDHLNLKKAYLNTSNSQLTFNQTKILDKFHTNDQEGNYKLANSEFHNIKFNSDSTNIDTNHSKMINLGIDLEDELKFNSEYSELTNLNLEANGNTTNYKMHNSKLLDNNKINGDETYLDLIHINQDLNLKFTRDENTSILYNNSNYKGDSLVNKSTTNSLKTISNSGQIKIIKLK